MSGWLWGFISGVIATIIGFILTMIWDYIKWKREEKRRENVVIEAVKDEIETNIDLLEKNKKILAEELYLFHKHMISVTPLSPLKTGFWDLVKINLPKKLTQTDIFLRIRNAAQLTYQINEIIRSREDYKIHNGAMSNYHSVMESYDGTLLSLIDPLLKSLRELDALLQA